MTLTDRNNHTSYEKTSDACGSNVQLVALKKHQNK